MGNMHLVTGYQGKEHVTAADHGSLYAAIFGGGSYVLDRGNKLAASMITSNQVRIADGDMVIQGRHARLNEGATVDLTIESGAQGQKRNDLVVARYTRNASSGVEEVNLVVIKGTPATSDPTDPAYANGDILTDHAETVDFPLYRIPLDGITVGTPVQLFDVAYLVTLGSDKKVPAEYLPSMDYIPNSKRGAANGVAPLNSSKKIDSTYLPSMNYISTSQRGAANGVASLDSTGKVPLSQIPDDTITSGKGTVTTNSNYDTLKSGSVYYYRLGKICFVYISCEVTRNGASNNMELQITGIPEHYKANAKTGADITCNFTGSDQSSKEKPVHCHFAIGTGYKNVEIRDMDGDTMDSGSYIFGISFAYLTT